jgi:hypothetical protein
MTYAIIAAFVLLLPAVTVMGQQKSVATAQEVYSSPDRVFRFQYPGRLKLHSEGSCLGNLVCVEWPSDYVYKGYNFAGAQFWVGTAKEPEGAAESSKKVTTESDCLAFHGYPDRLGSTVINGVRFATRSWTEGAAGTSGEFQLFRTFYNGVCYELATEVLVADAGYSEEDYASGRVRRFTKTDNAQVKGVLNGIVNSFRFLK